MGRKKVEEKEEGAYWMDTYGDMVTLLLTFFVLLFAMSSLDSEKYEIFVKAFQSKFSTKDQFVIIRDPNAESDGEMDVIPAGDKDTVGISKDVESVEDVESFDDLYMYLKKFLEEQGLTDSIRIEKGDGFVYVSFDNSIFFEPDDPRLLPKSKELLDVICQVISQIPDQIGEIHAHGHTAQEFSDRPNSVPFDRTLSATRATNVIIYLEQHSKVTGERLKDTGHGQHTPLKPHDDSEETRKLNRRCELVIAEMDTAPPTLTEIYAMINDPNAYKDIEGLPPTVSSPTKPSPPTTETTSTPEVAPVSE